MLAGLDAELAMNSQQIGQPLEWSAAESAFRELIADTIDRRVDLQALYADSVDDPKTRLKVCAELRLIETALARLLSKDRDGVAGGAVAHVAESVAGGAPTMGW